MIYNSPSCDVTLICSDDVKISAHSFVLRTFSSIMNDMLGATALTADNKPLEFPEASHIVKQFLDLAYDTPEPVSLDSAVDVARFCDKYFAPRVTKMLVQGLHTAVKLSPFDAWKVFGIASQIEDSHLAATAILHFGSGARVIEAEYRGRVIAHKPFSEWLAADVSNVTSVYLAMYVKAHQLWEQETGVNSVGHKSNLSQIAKLFSKHISPPMPAKPNDVEEDTEDEED